MSNWSAFTIITDHLAIIAVIWMFAMYIFK